MAHLAQCPDGDQNLVGRRNYMRTILFISVLLFGLLGVMSSCKKPVKKEVEVTPPEAKIPTEHLKELPPAEMYPKAIKPSEDVEKTIQNLVEYRNLAFKGEKVTFPESLTNEVRGLIVSDKSIGEKVYAAYELKRARGELPDDILDSLSREAKKAELTPELAFVVGLMNREKLVKFYDENYRKERGVLESSARMTELSQTAFDFFKKAYELRKIEPLYVLGLQSAYYDFARAKLGGKDDYQKIFSELPIEARSKLMDELDQLNLWRSLISPPWLVYESNLHAIAPPIYKDCEILSTNNLSIGDFLLTLLYTYIDEENYESALKIIQKIRLAVTMLPITMDLVRYSNRLTLEMMEKVEKKIPLRYRRQLKKHYDIYKSVSQEIEKKYYEASEKKKQYILEDVPERAKKEEILFVNDAAAKVAYGIDSVEDVLKLLNVEQMERSKG